MIQAQGRSEYPASVWQEGLWVQDSSAGPESVYRGTALLRISGTESATSVVEAVRRIVARHSTLRTRLVTEGVNGLRQVIDAEDLAGSRVEEIPSGSEMTDDICSQRLARLAERGWERPFAAAVFSGPGHPLRLGINAHHAVWDGPSMGLFAHELLELLASTARMRPPVLPSLPVQYGDYADWQRISLSETPLDLSYWESLLQGASLDIDWPGSQSLDPKLVGQSGTVSFDHKSAPAIAALTRELRVTPFGVALAATGVALGLHCYRNDVVIGTPVTARMSPELRSLIGFFVNVLPIRIRFGRSETIRELVADVHGQLFSALQRSNMPGRNLLPLMGAGGPRRMSPYPILCQSNTPLSGGWTRDGITIELIPQPSETARHDATIAFDLRPLSAVSVCEYARGLFDEEGASALLQHIATVLDQMCSNPDRAVRSISLRAQRRAVPARATATHEPFTPIAHRLRNALAIAGACTVVTAEDGSLTGNELLDRIDRIADELAARGIGPESIVAVPADRSLGMVTAILGVAVAGATYWPFGSRIPRERLHQMIEEAKPSVVLCPGLSTGLLDLGLPVELLQSYIQAHRSSGIENTLMHPAGSFSLLFTSGSTGRPKGVLNTQEGILNRVVWMQERYSLGADDVVLHKTPATFDVATWEIFWPLMYGSRMVVARPEGHLDMRYLADLCQRESVTTMHFVPSMLSGFLQEPVASRLSLKRVICSGEVLTPRLAIDAARVTGARISNLYGPTEAAIDVTAWDVDEVVPEGRVPIGRAIDNVSVVLLDRELRPVPAGSCGQIAIGGLAPARGYVGRPDATAARFVPDPLASPPGARVYLTGDLGMERRDGALEFIRRIDTQLKVAGVRIEVEDIEDAIRQIVGTAEVAVVVRARVGAPPLLTAYVAGSRGVLPTGADIRAAVRQRFSVAALSGVTFVEALPRTESGKVNRSELERLARNRELEDDPQAVSAGVESDVAAVWKQVLEVDEVGRTDNFFELGGHSIAAVRVIAALERRGYPASLEDLFDHPVLREFAFRIANESRVAPPEIPWPQREPERTSFPTSPGQTRLWLLEQLKPGTPMYNVPGAVRLRGSLDPQAFEAALALVISRHDAFRTSFHSNRGIPIQVLSSSTEVRLEMTDLRNESIEVRSAIVEHLREKCADEPFDLTRPPLLRTRLIRTGENEYLFLVTMHHLLCDAWSLSNLIKEVAEAYTAGVQGRPPEFPAVLQYPDYAVWYEQWVSTPFVSREVDYWTRTLDGAVDSVLPGDFRPAQHTHRAAVEKLVISSDVLRLIQNLGQKTTTTTFMVLLASFAATLRDFGADPEVVIATGVANRRRPEFESMIGFFVNFLPLRIRYPASATFQSLLSTIRDVSLQAIANQDAPFDEVVRALRRKRRSDRIAFGDIAFVHQNVPRWKHRIPGLSWEMLEDLDRSWTAYDLHLSVEDGDGELTCYLAYATDRFKSETVKSILNTFQTTLKAAVLPEKIARLDLGSCGSI